MGFPRRAFLLAALASGLARGSAPQPAASRRHFAEDFDSLWRAIDHGYAYLDRARGDWARVRAEGRARATAAGSRAEFVAALEVALARLRDDHVALSERTPQSPRRIPGDTDLWAVFRGGGAVVESVRAYGDADVAGIRPGHGIARIAGVPAERAVRDWLRAGPPPTEAEREWALNHALAGPREGKLAIVVREPRGERTLEIERHAAKTAGGPPLVARRMGEDRDLGYLRIKSALDEPGLAGQFDGALDHLGATRALILDLREVGDARSHDATRAILGRFAARPSPWQAREAPGAPRMVDTVEPRGTPYRAPVLVLVDRWTAGEGEALAAGMQAVAGARLVGTPMAGLRGELAHTRLPHSAIVLRYPAQKALHVDGTPREQLRPHVAVDLAAPDGGPDDPILYRALKLLEKPPSPAPGGRSARG
jgi:carboxyl-terminal processing protease